jgi:hypothetical protein
VTSLVAESSKEGYASKRSVLPMMLLLMMMMMTMTTTTTNILNLLDNG